MTTALRYRIKYKLSCAFDPAGQRCPQRDEWRVEAVLASEVPSDPVARKVWLDAWRDQRKAFYAELFMDVASLPAAPAPPPP